MILSHIMQSIMSQENIQIILNSKNSIKLIKAADADYMNQAVYDKFAKTWAQREGVRTNADEVLRECRERIHRLYLEVAAYFGMSSQQQAVVNGRQFCEELGQQYQTTNIHQMHQGRGGFAGSMAGPSRVRLSTTSDGYAGGAP